MSQKHPKALPFLFFTEMWERFGYYLMIGIFQLYMTTPAVKGGLEMDREQAADIYGTFIALVFLTPFIGGMLADRWLGYKNSVIIGALLMGIGYAGLSIPGDLFFYGSLTSIIIGNGFFKPNISTLLGNLYSVEPYVSRKDAGYNIFYMGINIGALICNFFAAYMRNRYGWGAAFLTAGVGMFIGLAVFISAIKHVKDADRKPEDTKQDQNLTKVLLSVFLPAIAIGTIGWMINGNIFGSDSTDAFLFACIPVVVYYISLIYKTHGKHRNSMMALLSIMAVSVMFWAVFKQNGTALTTYAQFYTDREVPEVVRGTAETLYLSEKISTKQSMVPLYDHQYKAIRDSSKKQMKGMDYDVYLRNIPIEEKSQKADYVVFNTELYQSINPFWVVLLTPLVVAFFTWLRRKGKEPGTPTKIAWGLLISALSCFVMVFAVMYTHNGEIKASSWWLIGAYGVITIGELFLSPMGLSLVSKLSPPGMTALMMGGWFLATSIGNKLSGVLAGLWDTYSDKKDFFLVNFGLLFFATLVMFGLLKWLRKLI